MSDRMTQLMAGVDEDGTVEDCEVETHVALPYALTCPQQYGYKIDDDNKFVAFICDNGATDIEVRLPFEVVEFIANLVAKSKGGAA